MTPVQKTTQETAFFGAASAAGWLVYQVASIFAELPGDETIWVLALGTVLRGIGGVASDYLPNPRGRPPV
jgi:hypothetical protein